MPSFHPMLSRYVIPDMPSTTDLLPWLRQIDQNRWYSNFGPLVSEFEDRLSHYLSESDTAGTGTISVMAGASCFHTLQIALRLLNLPRRARVLVPALTFPACPLAIRHAGAEPILADVDPTSWQLTPATALQAMKLTPIEAVMPVAVYGMPVATEGWDRFTEETGVPVVIDAAAAFESQHIPKHGLTAFSLHATKPFSVGEGGLLVSRDRAMISEARSISNFGMHNRVTIQDGVNAKMSEYHGAVALAQLARWSAIKECRNRLFKIYQHKIIAAGFDVSFQSDIEHNVVSVVMLRSSRADSAPIIAHMNENQVAAHRMYLPPLYRHPHFGDLSMVGFNGGLLYGGASDEEKADLMKNCEALNRSLFGVPFHAFMDGNDMDYVVASLSEALRSSELRTIRQRAS